jgi:large-conductance mechanosensitive channel
MLGEFKKFVMRGNLLELAVAFIMGVDSRVWYWRSPISF